MHVLLEGKNILYTGTNFEVHLGFDTLTICERITAYN